MKVESLEEKLMRLAEALSKMRHPLKQQLAKQVQATKDKLASFYEREAMAKVDAAFEKIKEAGE